jgi:hypothetical protein
MLRAPEGTKITWLNVVGSGFLKDENEIARFRIDGFEPTMKVQANPNFMIDIAVDETPPPCADNDTLGNRLFYILLFVESLVDAFESFFSPKKSTKKRTP